MALKFKFSEQKVQNQTALNCPDCCLTASYLGLCGCAGKENNTFIYQKDQAEHSILLLKSSEITFQVVFSHDRQNDGSE